MQMGELPESLAVLWAHTGDETWVIQLCLAFRFIHVAELVQSLHDRLAALRRHLLPARKQRLLNFALLIGSHLLPNLLTVPVFLLLRGSQFIPGLEALANLRLLAGRQTLETLVILEEFFLPLGSHILEAVDRLGRQIILVPAVVDRCAAVHAGAHRIGSFHRRRCRTAIGRFGLGNPAELLREGGRHYRRKHQDERQAENGANRQKGSPNGRELEAQLHYLVSVFTSPVAALGISGNSESASNLETTS